jgi:hypothetical protein
MALLPLFDCGAQICVLLTDESHGPTGDNRKLSAQWNRKASPIWGRWGVPHHGYVC